MSAIVEVRHLQKHYSPPDGVVAVKDVSFEIGTGEVFSLLGPNGAGKTTTISMLSCLVAPTGGEATVAGHSITRAPMQVKRVIGVVPQEIALYPTISARENLEFWGRMYGLRGPALKARIEAALDIAGLADRAKDRVETYSGGMRRRLNIAVGLLHEPQVLYLDEPTVGIDPQSRRRILDTIKTLNAQGMTVLYTTHYMEEAEELSHRIGIIDHGELIALGTLAELTQLVGEFDTLDLCLDLNGADRSELVRRLEAVEGVRRVILAEDAGDAELAHVLVQVSEADSQLGDVVAAASRAGSHIKQLVIREPNLETVFLHLAGRGLRD